MTDSIDQCFEKHEKVGCLVFPGVEEGVDWGLFKKKIKEDSYRTRITDGSPL